MKGLVMHKLALLFIVISHNTFAMFETQKNSGWSKIVPNIIECLYHLKMSGEHPYCSGQAFTRPYYDHAFGMRFSRDCAALACTNKIFSNQNILYHNIRLTWADKLFSSPLFLIIEQRRRVNESKSRRLLNVAQKFLDAGSDIHFRPHPNDKSPLETARHNKDTALITLFSSVQ